MGRHYAGVLGPLAFFLVAFRGLVHGGGIGSTLEQAILFLFAFAAAGFCIGELAGWIVLDSVRTQVSLEIAAAKATESPIGTTKR